MIKHLKSEDLIVLKNGQRMSPLRLDQIKASDLQENSQERLKIKQDALVKAMTTGEQVQILDERFSQDEYLDQDTSR